MPDRADIAIARYLGENGYHPRSSKHGDALCNYVLDDLLHSCPSFRSAADVGRIVFQRNYTVSPNSPDQWNADLVVGPPASPAASAPPRPGSIRQEDPGEIWLAVDAKTIMTEHGKARRNRQRDLNSFQDILHRRSPKTIVGGLLVVNLANRFQTPLPRKSGGLNEHRNIGRLVDEIVVMIGGLARGGPSPGQPGIEALGIIVVSHTNVSGDPSRLVVEPPAPPDGHPLSYTAFLRELCEAFAARFTG